MWKVAKEFKIYASTNTLIGASTIIDFKATPILEIKRRDDGQLDVRLRIYNSNGIQIAAVRNEKITEGDRKNYIVSSDESRYAVEEKDSGRVIVEIRKGDDKSPITALRIELNVYLPEGRVVETTPTEVKLVNPNGGSSIIADTTVTARRSFLVIEDGRYAVGGS